MILQLSEALQVPLRDRNAWLASAGFAPLFPVTTLDAPDLALVRSAVRRILANHEPYPAVAIDRAWNIQLLNSSFESLLAAFGPGLWDRIGGGRNLMRLFFHPAGVRRHVDNWESIAPILWSRARHEAEAAAGEDMKKVLEDLGPLVEDSVVSFPESQPLLPVLPLHLSVSGAKLALFTVISTFGTPQDVTTDELRIESFFPADEASANLLIALATSQAPHETLPAATPSC